MARARPVELTEDQALWFRARRGHLAGPGAKDAVAAARDVLGAQSQQLAPSLLALSLRTAGRPAATELAPLLLDAPRGLVRTWGQRETIHVYDPHGDWPAVVAARRGWAPSARNKPPPPQRALEAARRVLREAQEPVTRRHIAPIVPTPFARHFEDWAGSLAAAKRAGAGRLLWNLAMRGEAVIAEKIGAEQGYVARERWFGHVDWSGAKEDAHVANVALARRYLALHGPATPQDLAHFLGARVTAARKWLADLEAAGELLPVRCAERDGLVALAADERTLRARPPSGERAWPTRLLPLWDTLLMAHADKSWTAPAEAERKQVWRKAALVAATVVHRGRIVATWSQEAKRGRLDVAVAPLGGWRAAKHFAPVRREARAVAQHLGLEPGEVRVEG